MSFKGIDNPSEHLRFPDFPSVDSSKWESGGHLQWSKFDPHQNDKTCSSYQVLPPEIHNSQNPIHLGVTLRPEDILHLEPHVSL